MKNIETQYIAPAAMGYAVVLYVVHNLQRAWFSDVDPRNYYTDDFGNEVESFDVSQACKYGRETDYDKAKELLPQLKAGFEAMEAKKPLLRLTLVDIDDDPVGTVDVRRESTTEFDKLVETSEPTYSFFLTMNKELPTKVVIKQVEVIEPGKYPFSGE